jgi:preprotein translocase subunit SecA
VLKYDLVVHTQREALYAWRRTLVTGEGFDPIELIRELIDDLVARCPDRTSKAQSLRAHFHAPFDVPEEESAAPAPALADRALEVLRQRERAIGSEVLRELGRVILLEAMDDLWTDHLSNLERVEEGIGLQGYAGVDPIIAWQKEAAHMWRETLWQIRSRAVSLWFLVDAGTPHRR